MKKLLRIGFSILMILSLVACIGGEDTKIPSTEPIESTEKFEPYSIGDFSAKNFDGETVSKDVFSDYDLTMINLWTTTCSYCIEEMPYLNELRNEFHEKGKKFNVISICMDIGNTEEINEDNLAIAKEIIEKTNVSYENLIPDNMLLEGRLKGVQAFPESFFVDRNGNVVSEPYIGALPKNHWRVVMNNEINKIEKE